MENQLFDPERLIFLLFNCPLVGLNLAANIFCAWCLRFPSSNRQNPKQPLKLLLEFLTWSTVIYSLCFCFTYDLLKERPNSAVSTMVWMCVVYYTQSNMMCSVWLNFYYYIQIVPSQRPLLIWIKRNIKPFCYASFLAGEVFIVFQFCVVTAAALSRNFGSSGLNTTQAKPRVEELYFTYIINFSITKLLIFLFLCVMGVSSFSTFQYLHGHIRNVALGGLPTHKVRSQIRVAITGISQGVLYISYCIFYIVDSLSSKLSSNYEFIPWLTLSVTSLYMSGTTVNVAISQTLFSQRALDVWKGLKALRGGTASKGRQAK